MFKKELIDIVVKNCGHESEEAIYFSRLCEEDYSFDFLLKVALTLIRGSNFIVYTKKVYSYLT